MISLLISLIVLITGYNVYGRFTEKVFSPDDRTTPAIAKNDGVDFVPMKTWKSFLVQLLNIAGTGPIFGALIGGGIRSGCVSLDCFRFDFRRSGS